MYGGTLARYARSQERTLRVLTLASGTFGCGPQEQEAPRVSPCYPHRMTILELGTAGKIEVGVDEGQVFIAAYRHPNVEPTSFRLSLDQARQLRDAVDKALSEAVSKS